MNKQTKTEEFIKANLWNTRIVKRWSRFIVMCVNLLIKFALNWL